MWASWGVTPDAAIGHSLGEYAAACVAGVMSPEVAVRVLVARGRLAESYATGYSMLSVNAEESAVTPLLDAYGLSIVAFNAADRIVLAGPRPRINAAAKKVSAAGVKCAVLAVSHASHHAGMQPVADGLIAALQEVMLRPPSLALVSNVTGGRIGEEIAQPTYWGRHVLEPVRFREGVRALADLGCSVFLELGGDAVLTKLGARVLGPEAPARWIASLRSDRDERHALGMALASLFAAGAAVDWKRVHAGTARGRETLPTYPFQRRRRWLPDSALRPDGERAASPTAALRRVESASERELILEARLDPVRTPYLLQHRVGGELWAPSATMLALAVAGVRSVTSAEKGAALENVEFLQPLRLSEDRATTVQLVLSLGSDRRLRLAGRAEEGGWTTHLAATFARESGDVEASGDEQGLEALRAVCPRSLPIESVYARLEKAGLEYGPDIRRLVSLRVGEGQILAEAAAGGVDPTLPLDSALLDSCLQALAGLLPDTAGVMAPAAIERFWASQASPPKVWLHARMRPTAGGDPLIDMTTFAADGSTPAFRLRGLRLGRVAGRARSGALIDGKLYEAVWRPAPHAVSARDSAWPPPPDSVRGAVETAAKTPQVASALEEAAERRRSLEQASQAWAANALRALWPVAADAPASTDALVSAHAVAPGRRRLLKRLFVLAEDGGWVERDGEAWRLRGEPQALAAATERPTRAHTVESALLERCGPVLVDVLTGRADPLALLFGEESGGVVAELYRSAAETRAMNACAAAAIRAFADAFPADRPLRILEIGAGTGATSEALLGALGGRHFAYCCSDVAPVFVAQAKARFASDPRVTARLFDVEREPSAQGLADGGFDIVVAANVLHATRDLRRTLAHARSLLAPSGTLLLVEGVTSSAFLDVTFGLTDGWWRFEDEDLRDSHPLLPAAAWIDLLARSGFDAPAALSPGAELGAASGQAVIMACRAGDEAAKWLLLADRGGVAPALSDMLGKSGAARELAATTDLAADEAAVRAALHDHPRGLVCLWGLDARATDANEEGALAQSACVEASERLLAVIRALSAHDGRPQRLFVVTRGAETVRDPGGDPHLTQTVLAGLVRTLAFEHPSLRPTLVDLDPGSDATELLVAEILSGAGEPEVAFRDGVRFVRRISAVETTPQGQLDAPETSEEHTYALVAEPGGGLESLAFRRVRRRAPEAGEVEVQVEATALHFRDLLSVLGAYRRGADGEPGTECAGIVVRTGPGVDFKIGDRVVALCQGAFRGHVTIPVELVARDPGLGALRLLDAAAYLTARDALAASGAKAGDPVLVHAAAGATGLAVVEAGRAAGLDMLGSASPWKWPALRARGVRRLFNSRTLAFAEGAREATGGEGVAAVINSLADEAVEAGVSALRPGGAFVELGANAARSTEASARRPDIRRRAIDLAVDAERDPAALGRRVRDTVALLGSGDLPELPRRAFPLDLAPAAFRHMQAADQIGRVAIDHRRRFADTPQFDPEAAYLLTGGLGGLGLSVAQWMVERGARTLALMSRRPPGPEAARIISRISGAGVAVMTIAGDVADAKDLASALTAVASKDRPLRGVVHAAGQLDDGVLARQNAARLTAVYRAKIAGVVELHRQTQRMTLDHFIIFSSAAALTGAPGQGGHAAANAFLDAFARYRIGRGLPAQSIQWGPWGEIGAAALRGPDGPRHVAGVKPLSPPEGLAALASVWSRPLSTVAALAVDWPAFAAAASAACPLLAEVAAQRTEELAPAVRTPSILARLETCAAANRVSLLRDFVAGEAAKALGAGSAEAIGVDQGFFDLGMDSLTSLELRNSLQRQLERPMPSTLTFDFPTVRTLADRLLEIVRGEEAGSPAPPPSHDSEPSDLEDMDVEALSAALAREIGELAGGKLAAGAR